MPLRLLVAAARAAAPLVRRPLHRRASPRRPGSRISSRSTGCAATTCSATASSSGSTTRGDSLRNSPFTEDAIVNLLERLGVNVTGEQIRARNVAAVLVTATLPPFARAGGQIDVTVSAIGDAESLLGGTLVMTPLNAADGQIYAVAQGSIIAGGIVAEGEAATVTQGVPTSGADPVGRAGRARGRLRLHPGARHAPRAAQPRLHHRGADRGGRSTATSARGWRRCSTPAPCGSTSPASASTSRRC